MGLRRRRSETWPGSEPGACDQYDVTFVAQRIAHHALHSGYHLLADHVPAEVLQVGPPKTLAQRAGARVVDDLVARRKSAWYSRSSAFTELQVAAGQLRSGRHLVHHLYGEHTFALGVPFRRRGTGRTKLVASFHTPMQRLRELMPDLRALQRLDGVVAVSTAQLEGLADVVGADRVRFIPHGVDIDFFSAASRSEPEVPMFLTVGHHLRDLRLLAEVAGRVARASPGTRFLVVARAGAASMLQDMPNLSVVSGIDDEHLRDLYRSATALLMPVTDATANNALLEATACGLPVISTDLAGIRDYTDEGCRVLTPVGDVSAATDAVLAAARAELDLSAMAAASRRSAERFAWHQVGEQIRQLHLALWS